MDQFFQNFNFQLDRTDPLSFGPKFPENLVEWIAPLVSYSFSLHEYSFFCITTLEVKISDKDKEDIDKNMNFENFAYKFKASPGQPGASQ